MHHRILALTATLPEQIWRILSQRWLLLLFGGVTFCLVICGFTLEQLPANFQDDPIAVSRWMGKTSLYYGKLGNLFRDLGLFNILHSQLLHVLLTVTGLLLLIQLANLIDAAYTLSRLPSHLDQPISANDSDTSLEEVAGHTLALPPTYQTLLRQRAAYTILPERVTARIVTYLGTQFEYLHRKTLPLQITAEGVAKEKPDMVEERLLVIHSPEMIWLRILLVVGLLLATLAVSFTVILGWAIETESLEPSEGFRNVQPDIELDYHVVTPITESEMLATHLQIRIGDAKERLCIATRSSMRIGAARVWAEPDQPALLISATGEKPLLARPGQFSPSAMIGLLFPSPGSEESVILPRERIVLRIVRIPDSNLPAYDDSSCQKRVISNLPEDDTSAFMLEIFQEALNGAGTQVLEREYIGNQQPTTFFINGLDEQIRLDPVPSLQVEAYYRPGLWLVWPALVMIVVGMIGFRHQPRFLMVQICPWPIERSVVVIQGNRAADVENIEAWLDKQSQD